MSEHSGATSVSYLLDANFLRSMVIGREYTGLIRVFVVKTAAGCVLKQGQESSESESNRRGAKTLLVLLSNRID